MNLSVVIPFRDGHEDLVALLGDLPSGLPIVIVDDQSNRPLTREHINNGRGDIRIIRPDKRGYFAGAVNVGLDECDGDALILNQDVRLQGTAWLDHLIEHRRKYAVIGDGVKGHPAWPAGYVQGTFMYMRRDAIDKVGKLDARYYPLWGGTCEWQLRACRQGYRALPAEVPGLSHKKRTKSRFGQSITSALGEERDKWKLLIRTPPMVSVVIPCYRYAHFLTDAINSLVGGPTSLGLASGQTLQSFEIIIVDDASPDNTPEIGQALANPWHGIRYIRLPSNRGTPGALNAGVDAAMGQYIHILSADDMREPICLEELHSICEANPHSVAYGNVWTFGHGKRIRKQHMRGYNFKNIIHKNAMPAGIMYPKIAWEEAGGYPESMIHGREDWAFNIALGIKEWYGVKSDKFVNLYRREGHNRSLHTYNIHKGETRPDDNGITDWYAHFRQQLCELFPELYEEAGVTGCCGQRGGRNVVRGRRIMAARRGGSSLAGREGMTLIEYIGGNHGIEPWYGEATKTRYAFGGTKRTGYVDARDVPHFLGVLEGKRPIFRLVKIVAPTPAPAPAPAPAPVAIKALAPSPVPEAIPESLAPEDLTVIKGVGARLAAQLVEGGFITVSGVADANLMDLAESAVIPTWRAEKIIEGAKVAA